MTGDRINLDPTAVRMTPAAGEVPTFSYRREGGDDFGDDGEELITVSYPDVRVGAVEQIYTLGMAEFIARNVLAMVTGGLDGLRRDWAADHA
ncbi:MAG: hypothetical protein JWR34_4327 [Mycobacterium sp.]|nr:hypothetical protein [Mycobacterium sp.]